jgi:hypothetical protein
MGKICRAPPSRTLAAQIPKKLGIPHSSAFSLVPEEPKAQGVKTPSPFDGAKPVPRCLA